MVWESIIEHCHNERVLCDVNNAYSAIFTGWLRDTLVERRSLTGELSLSCARPVADGWPLMSVNRPL